MREGIKVEDIKAYNKSLREYKEKANKLRVELEFNRNELNKQCQELSSQLGIAVTMDNVEQILEDRIHRINDMMAVGTEIIRKIKLEEERIEQGEIDDFKQTVYSRPEEKKDNTGIDMNDLTAGLENINLGTSTGLGITGLGQRVITPPKVNTESDDSQSFPDSDIISI